MEQTERDAYLHNCRTPDSTEFSALAQLLQAGKLSHAPQWPSLGVSWDTAKIISMYVLIYIKGLLSQRHLILIKYSEISTLFPFLRWRNWGQRGPE